LDHKMNSKEEEKPYISPNEICKYVFIRWRPVIEWSNAVFFKLAP
jgi:hypothetical protein